MYFINPQVFNGSNFYNQDIYSAQNSSQYSLDQCQCINIFILLPQAPNFNAYYQQQPTITTIPYIMNGQPSQIQMLPQPQFNFGFPNYLVPPPPLLEVKKANKHKKEKKKQHDKSKQSKSKKSQHHIPKKPNTPPPPPPPPNIDIYCTYSVTGTTYGEQKWYYCRTCGLTNYKGVCAICAKKCHAGHDLVPVYKRSEIKEFYCDCPDHGNCCCMPQSEDLQCTFEITKGNFVEQPMYECLKCRTQRICQNCAIRFHKNHRVRVTNCIPGDVCFYYKQNHGDVSS